MCVKNKQTNETNRTKQNKQSKKRHYQWQSQILFIPHWRHMWSITKQKHGNEELVRQFE